MVKYIRYLLSFCFCCLFCVFQGAEVAHGSLSISPAFLEISLDRGRPSGQFVISNTGDNTVRYRIQASHFTFGADGSFQVIPPDENSLSEWIKFNPRELSLPPKSSQRVRFVIIPRGQLRDQLYWGAMELESLQPNISRGEDQHGRSMTLAVIPAIVVPIFASHGDLKYDFEIKDLKVHKTEQALTFETMVHNTGTGQLMTEGYYDLVDAAGDEVASGKFLHTYIMPNTRVQVENLINHELPSGEYQLRVECRAKNLERLESTTIYIP